MSIPAHGAVDLGALAAARQAQEQAETTAAAAEAAAALPGPVLEIPAFRFAAKPHCQFSSPPQCLG